MFSNGSAYGRVLGLRFTIPRQRVQLPDGESVNASRAVDRLTTIGTCVLIPQVWWELEGPQVPLRPDCLAIVNNFAFLLGGEELGPDGEFHASSKVYRYDPRQNSWLRMADMSVPR